MLKLIESLLSPKKSVNSKEQNHSIQNETKNVSNLLSSSNSGSDKTLEDSENYYKQYQKLPTDHTIKILILGGYNVGKSSILRRYLQDCFTKSYLQTIGIDLSSMMIEQDSNINKKHHHSNHHHHHHHHHHIPNRYLISFLDISHAEIKGNHIQSLFQEVSGIIMVFDSTNANSILAMDEWKVLLNKYQVETKQSIPIALFANKSDMGNPVISSQELDYYCKQCGYDLWRFTSPKNDIGVKDGIDQLITFVLEKTNKEIESRKAAKALAQQQIQKKPSKNHTSRVVSHSLPNPQTKSLLLNTANNNQDKLLKEKQKEKEKSMEILQINEILERTNSSYDRIQLDLDELMNKFNGSKRYNDLIKLERQRGSEYVNICNSLKKLIQPNFPHTSRNKLTKEVIINTLEDNIKKWETLINNLQLEHSLKLSSSVSSLPLISTPSLPSGPNMQTTTITTTTITTTTTTTNNTILLSSTSTTTSPTKPRNFNSNRYQVTPNQNANNNKSKMGFGFKNNAKMVSMATSLFNPSNNYNNIDTDNPNTSSSITTSSPTNNSTFTYSSSLTSTSSSNDDSSNSTSVSPNQTPIGSLSTSPSLLPSSYNLNVTLLPESLVFTGVN